MLGKCFNPKCSAKFHYWHDGRLFLNHESNQRRAPKPVGTHVPPKFEFVWLCSVCSAQLTVGVRADGTATIVPLRS